jgi:hypothetical protein
MKHEAVFFLAGVTLVGGVAIGKYLVDSAQKLPSPPIGKQNQEILGDSVKLVATLVGLSISLVQLPRAWDEAQKLVAEVAP